MMISNRTLMGDPDLVMVDEPTEGLAPLMVTKVKELLLEIAHVTKNSLTPWAEDVAAASNGELEIQMFPGGTLGRSPAQQLKLVEDGVADIAWVIPEYTPVRFDQGTVSELPFMIPNSVAGSAAMWSMYEQGLFTGDYDKFKLIGVMVSAPNGLATIAEIKAPSDLKGLNLRAPGPTMLSAIDALGAVPVGGITGPTMAESMSLGLIDGNFTQWGVIETFRMGEVVKNYLSVLARRPPGPDDPPQSIRLVRF